MAAPDPPTLQPTEVRVQLRLAPRLPAPHGVTEGPGSRGLALVREADFHFQAGRRRYQEGDEAGARREFDRAIDLLLSAPDMGPSGRGLVQRRLEELVDAIHHYDLAGLGAADVTSDPAFEKSPLEDIPPLTFPVDPRLKTKVVDEIRATLSQLPLQASDAVLAYIHYFSSERGLRILTAGLRRAGRYRPLIQRILDEEGMPQELIFLAQAESGFLPRAVSRKAAAGMWQFVRWRGNQYGLMQTPYTDDRLDPEKATRAAARHLRDLYQQFGDWYLALAAYNCGPGCVERAVERTGYADFWEFRRRNVLPKETANYVPIILAMTIMVKNAREYGLEGLDTDPPLQYDTVEIAAATNLLLMADLADCPLTEVRELNPALLKNVAPPGYLLRVPKGAGGVVTEALASIPAERRNAWRMHRVGDGDTLAAVARRYRVGESSILAVNESARSGLERGDLLLIPASAQTAAKKVVASRTAARSSSHAKKASPKKTTTARATRKPTRPVTYTAQTRTRRASARR